MPSKIADGHSHSQSETGTSIEQVSGQRMKPWRHMYFEARRNQSSFSARGATHSCSFMPQRPPIMMWTGPWSSPLSAEKSLPIHWCVVR